jgi:Stage II sporulation protein E (SpoIIE)/PDZ domain
MARSSRVLLVVLATLIVVGLTVSYAASRVWHWHQIGMAGMTYWPEMPREMPLPNARSGGVYMVLPGGAAERAGIFPGDDLIAINGHPYKDQKPLQELDKRLRRGDTVVYRVRHKGVVRDVPVKLGSPLSQWISVAGFAVSLIVGVTFIAIGIFIFAKQPDDRRVWVFYAMVMVGAVYYLSATALALDASSMRGIAAAGNPNLAPFAALMLAAVAFVPLTLHLALVFPRARPIVLRSPYILRWVYGAPTVTAIVLGLTMGGAALVESRGDDFGRMVRTPINVTLAVFSVAGAVLALYIARKGRTEGTWNAFWHRPWSTLFAGVALFLGVARIINVAADVRWVKIVTGFLFGLIVCSPLFIMPVLACITLYRSYRDAGAEERRQVKWPLWGTFIPVAMKILAGFGVQIVGMYLLFSGRDFARWMGTAQLLDLFATLTYVLIPISFAFAILKYRLMNIDVIIRKTVAYGLLSGAIIVLYLALVGGLGTVLVNVAGVKNQTMVIASTLVVALLIVPLRNKLQTLVDRNLFRHKYDYPEALKAISGETLAANDMNAFLSSAAEKTQQALQNRAVVIFSPRHDEFVAAAKVGAPDSLLGALRVQQSSMLPMLDRPFDPRKHTLPEDVAGALKRIEAVLVVPINTPGTAANGFIALAPKLSGGGFEIEDIDFLRGVADQLDIGMDRIRLQAEEADFEQARAIQQTLLPRELPQVDRLDVSGTWQPARTMGGDYFDVLSLGDRELAVCIGDVAGKGMPAALLMSGLQAAVRASASGSPRDLCERVRRVVVTSLSGGRFVTFFYATLNTEAMKLRWCNAGHNAPVLARADGSILRLSEGGPAFSRLFRQDPYEERELDLQPGDRLVLFTDGVSESRGEDGEHLGEARIEEIARAHRTKNAREIQQTIVETATAYSGGQLEDDLTLVVVAVM